MLSWGGGGGGGILCQKKKFTSLIICHMYFLFKGIGDVLEPLNMTIKLEIKQESQDMEIDETPDTDLSNREACFMLFNKFTKEV